MIYLLVINIIDLIDILLTPVSYCGFKSPGKYLLAEAAIKANSNRLFIVLV
jgi:hypothetical protein